MKVSGDLGSRGRVSERLFNAVKEGLGQSAISGLGDERVLALKDRFASSESETDCREILGENWRRVPGNEDPTFELVSPVDSDSQRLRFDLEKNTVLLSTTNMTLMSPLSGFMFTESLYWSLDTDRVDRSYTNGSFAPGPKSRPSRARTRSRARPARTRPRPQS